MRTTKLCDIDEACTHIKANLPRTFNNNYWKLLESTKNKSQRWEFHAYYQSTWQNEQIKSFDCLHSTRVDEHKQLGQSNRLSDGFSVVVDRKNKWLRAYVIKTLWALSSEKVQFHESECSTETFFLSSCPCERFWIDGVLSYSWYCAFRISHLVIGSRSQNSSTWLWHVFHTHINYSSLPTKCELRDSTESFVIGFHFHLRAARGLEVLTWTTIKKKISS